MEAIKKLEKSNNEVFVSVRRHYLSVTSVNKYLILNFLIIASCLCFPLQIFADSSPLTLQTQANDTGSVKTEVSELEGDTCTAELRITTTASNTDSSDLTDKQSSNSTTLKNNLPKWKWTIQPAFQHWFSSTFGTPFGIGTPSIVIGVTPGCRFLETRVHYTASLKKLTLTDGTKSRVGFADLDILLIKEMSERKLSIVVGLGWMGGIIHTDQGLGGATGPVTFSRLMLHFSPRFAVGIFIDSRTQMYRLPGSDVPIISFSSDGIEFGHVDAQVQSGIAFSISRSYNANKR